MELFLGMVQLYKSHGDLNGKIQSLMPLLGGRPYNKELTCSFPPKILKSFYDNKVIIASPIVVGWTIMMSTLLARGFELMTTSMVCQGQSHCQPKATGVFPYPRFTNRDLVGRAHICPMPSLLCIAPLKQTILT